MTAVSVSPAPSVRFFNHTKPNRTASLEAGRAIFDDMECVEIIHPADKMTRKVFPAHEVITVAEDPNTGELVETTYAMKYRAQYMAFKNGEAQTLHGTPLSELPFLSEGKRRELKALSIYTAEQLAALDGQPLKNLGIGGRDLKNQAQAFIELATGNNDFASISAENASLKSRIEAMETMLAAQGKPTAPEIASSQSGLSAFEKWEDEDIKAWIKDATGARPQGNPNHETLVKLADEINAEAKAKAA